ncbi:MAG: 50S ribosomal protein L3 [Thermodesulfobacteriota bacterium]
MANGIGLIGKKLGMTSVFAQDGTFVPVTVIQAGPCPVINLATREKDGYNSVQLGFEELDAHKLNKPKQGYFKKNGQGYFRYLREFRIADSLEYESGQTLTVEVFNAGEHVKVTGRSKGKGFAGVMKRWGFSGSPATHGHEKVHRSTGAIGQCADPSKVFKGKKMPGRMGNAKVTYNSAEIVEIMPDENILLVKGQVPGPKNGIVYLRKQS